MSLFPCCLDLLDRPTTCPGCRAHVPGWVRVPVDGLRVLTHDGDLICPADPTFDASALVASPVVLVEVAA
ncbi:hypothetical protein ABZ468_38655 [Streptomyces sp. NPDC005708]|uniref:hypothetical protein n=1 Tax=Streptomyces sp. NPDC005708 TaxID=3154564 RepID=UPI0033DE4113